jgi:hypothetical protein
MQTGGPAIPAPSQLSVAAPSRSTLRPTVCRSYGLRFTVEADPPDRLHELIRWLPPHESCDEDLPPDTVLRVCWPTSDPEDLTLTIDGERPELAFPLTGLHLVESQAKLLVAERSPDFVFVHAGVVGWRGRAIVIPGASYAGKTTLVAALIAAGADYYSDEFAVVDARGLVHPFSRPLMVRQAGVRHWREPTDFGARQATRPIPASLILSTHYEAGGHWRPETLSAGQAVLKLLENTVSVRRDPQRAMKFCHDLTADALCWSGPRGSADQTAALILAACDDLAFPSHLNPERNDDASQTTND